jgi:hypothetical protein
LGTAEVLDANVFSPPSKKDATIDLNRRAFDLRAGLVTPFTTNRRLNPRVDHEGSDSEADPDATEPADSESVNVDLTPEDVQTQADSFRHCHVIRQYNLYYTLKYTTILQKNINVKTKNHRPPPENHSYNHQ